MVRQPSYCRSPSRICPRPEWFRRRWHHADHRAPKTRAVRRRPSEPRAATGCSGAPPGSTCSARFGSPRSCCRLRCPPTLHRLPNDRFLVPELVRIVVVVEESPGRHHRFFAMTMRRCRAACGSTPMKPSLPHFHRFVSGDSLPQGIRGHLVLSNPNRSMRVRDPLSCRRWMRRRVRPWSRWRFRAPRRFPEPRSLPLLWSARLATALARHALRGPEGKSLSPSNPRDHAGQPRNGLSNM